MGSGTETRILIFKSLPSGALTAFHEGPLAVMSTQSNAALTVVKDKVSTYVAVEIQLLNCASMQ